MARLRSARVLDIKAALTARLRGGFGFPGERFLSARAIARRFGVSYETAHRLLTELTREGMLQRRAASGFYVPGEPQKLGGVQLIFHPRARRQGSFGAHLLKALEQGLRTQDIELTRSWPTAGSTPRLRMDHYPVIWECRPAVDEAARLRRFALCVNNTPPAGVAGGHIDAITTDDFSGGACAAELLKRRCANGPFAVLGGPADDARSERRVAGFCAVIPGAHVVHAANWYVGDGRARAAEVLSGNPAGVFACNDRLAQALLEHCHEQGIPPPRLVGFDNAPIAEELGLTTVGIPWESLVTATVALVKTRLRGSTTPAKHIILPHQPVIRFTA